MSVLLMHMFAGDYSHPVSEYTSETTACFTARWSQTLIVKQPQLQKAPKRENRKYSRAFFFFLYIFNLGVDILSS